MTLTVDLGVQVNLSTEVTPRKNRKEHRRVRTLTPISKCVSLWCRARTYTYSYCSAWFARNRRIPQRWFKLLHYKIILRLWKVRLISQNM